jgi:hypothetical protein
MPPPFMSYGMSKAAENYLARKLHFEHESEGLGMLSAMCKEDFNISHLCFSCLSNLPWTGIDRRRYVASTRSAGVQSYLNKTLVEAHMARNENLRKVPFKPVDEIAPQITARIAEATRDNSGGQFLLVNKGERRPW